MKKTRSLQADSIWAAGVALLILLQFWWLPGSPGSTVDSYSNGTDGKLGLYRALGRLFPRVEREKERPVPDACCTLLIIGPDRIPTNAEQQQLAAFVKRGGTLLFAPSMAQTTIDLPELAMSFDALNPREDFMDADSGQPSVSPAAAGDSLVARSLSSAREVSCESPFSNESTKLIVASRLKYVPYNGRGLASGGGIQLAAAWDLGYGRVIACTTPDFFSNRSLLTASGGRLAVRLAAFGALQPAELQQQGFVAFDQSRIVISEYFNTTDSMPGTGVLFSSGLRIGTLQLILTAALSLWLGFHRFGPARLDLRLQRRSLTDTARAVGNLHYRSGDGGALVSARLDYLRGQLRRRYGSSVSIQNRASLIRISGLPSEEVSAGLDSAELQSGQPRLPVADAAVTIRWLGQLQRALLGTIPGRNRRREGTGDS
ncbi:MAG: DUF4350 domain-containing protein [Planctomycetaceae bacterium]